ncbi:MAG: formylglycine-generating enzyme family protein [Sphingomonadales bacterium]
MKRTLINGALALAVCACATDAEAATALETQAPPGFQIPAVVEIPAGPFVRGSDAAEREAAYRLDEAAYGHGLTRSQRWYEKEFQRGVARTGRYWISRTPVTNGQYAAFIRETGHAAPAMNRVTWESYRLVHPFDATSRFVWREVGASGDFAPPRGRENHPVVLVSLDDAVAYAQWLSRRTGQHWRLPTEEEWEKAARGTEGWRFPWGDRFDPAHLNSADAGPEDTVAVGRSSPIASPFGLLDAAGQVYEWTATSSESGRYFVKGGSWDDRGCGVCRAAARHTRQPDLRHVIIGFRLVRAPADNSDHGLRQSPR